MEERIPKVSIGLAVYNGETYLEKAIDSILAQTFTDFELIISDNASTDRTSEICQRYALQDKRVRYHRNESNIGGANNENQTFAMSRGKYFRWAADDDICDPRLLEKCVAILEQNPAIVLCYPYIVKIDQDGNEIGLLNEDLASSERPHERLRDLYDMWKHNCETTYGLIRSDMMRHTGLQLNYTDSDRTFLCELALYGRFYQVPEPLFYKRYHPKMSTVVYQDYRERMAWFDPAFAAKGRVALPHWMQFFHYLRIIARAPISFGERLRCYGLMVRWLFMYKRWGKMINDVIKAIKWKVGEK